MKNRSEYVDNEVHGSGGENRERRDWWTNEKGNVHFDVFATAEEIEGQTQRRPELIRNARLYTNQDIMSYAPDIQTSGTGILPQNRPTYNIVKSVIDTLNSRIGKARPRPYFLTTKGDYEKQDKAKKLQQFVDGFFDKENIYEQSKLAFRDACIFKLGALKLYKSNSDLKIEHVCPLEILVDETDGLYGSPQCLYQFKWIKRNVLEAKYPKYKAEIRNASVEQAYSNTLVVKVVEAWKKGAGGRHVLCIDSCTLVDEGYADDYFPFEFFRYDDAIIGFWGEDLVSMEYGIQIEINKIMRMISKAIELVAVPKVFMSTGSKVPQVSMNNKIGQIIKHAAGQPPVFYTPTAMNTEVYKYLDWLIQTGYEIPGLSKMSATSEKPAGLSSGKALRTFQDIESDRFSVIAQRWDNFFLSLTEKILSEAEKCYSGNTSVRVPGEKFLETVPWDDVSMSKDEYVLRIFSTALLPTQPAAKLEMVRELAEMGAIKPSRGPEIIDYSEVERCLYDNNGTANLVKYQLDLILNENKYQAPDPRMNIEQAFEIANGRFLDSMSQNVAQDKLELLSRYVEQIEELMAPPPAPPSPEVMDQEGMPPEGIDPELLAAVGADEAGMLPPPPDEAGMLPEEIPPEELVNINPQQLM